MIMLYVQFLVLDEADQLLDVGFQEELKVIFQILPENRQNLFFSETMTSNLQKMRDRYQVNMYTFEACKGLKLLDHLKFNEVRFRDCLIRLALQFHFYWFMSSYCFAYCMFGFTVGR